MAERKGLELTPGTIMVLVGLAVALFIITRITLSLLFGVEDPIDRLINDVLSGVTP